MLVIYQDCTELPEALTKGRISIPSSTFLSVTLMIVPFSLEVSSYGFHKYLDHSFLVRWVNWENPPSLCGSRERFSTAISHLARSEGGTSSSFSFFSVAQYKGSQLLPHCRPPADMPWQPLMVQAASSPLSNLLWAPWVLPHRLQRGAIFVTYSVHKICQVRLFQ